MARHGSARDVNVGWGSFGCFGPLDAMFLDNVLHGLVVQSTVTCVLQSAFPMFVIAWLSNPIFIFRPKLCYDQRPPYWRRGRTSVSLKTDGLVGETE